MKQYAPKLTLVVKNGPNGGFGWEGMEILHQPAFLNENVVDCIGAGDSFNAGFIHKFISGNSLAQCIEYGAPCRCYFYHQCRWYRSIREHGNYERIGNQIFQQNNLKETEHDYTKSIVVKYIVMREV